MKSTPLVLIAGFCGALSLGHGAETPTSKPAEVSAAAPAATAADAEYDALMAGLQAEPPSPTLRTEKPREYFQWMAGMQQAFYDAALAFAEKYPHDPRRWDGIVQSSYARPLFITGFKDDFDQRPGWSGLIEDQEKVKAFRAAQAARFAQLQASADASPRARMGAYGALVTEALGDYGRQPTPEHKAAYLKIVNEFADRIPSAVPILARSHLAFLAENGTPVEKAEFQKRLEGSGDPAVKRLLAESRGEYERFNGVAALAFTAADGRLVDVAKLRGKVVLIDFWATWCGPCVAEIPNVVANYEKYHDKGFEVIGVSLENPGAAKTDTPEQTAAKLEKAKQKMLAFTAARKMPWPQFFDGKWWKNDLAQRFGIESIPAMVLLSPDGKVVSIDARGPKLEAEIKRLLKL